MPEYNQSTPYNYSETDASCTQSPPNGAPAGMYPNQSEGVWRALMGATQRWWDRMNGTVTTTGSSNAYVYTPVNTSFPTAYVQGEQYTFLASFTNTGAATLDINDLGAKNIYKQSSAGAVALGGGEIYANQFVQVMYDGTEFQILNTIQQSASSGSSMVLLQTQTASNSSSIQFLNIPSTYLQCQLIISNAVTANSSVGLALQFSENNGSTFVGSSYRYTYFVTNSGGGSAAGGSGTSSSIVIGATNLMTVSDPESIIVNLFNLGSTTCHKSAVFQDFGVNGVAQANMTNGAGQYYGDVNAINALQIFAGSGNITSGTFSLYGIRNV